MTWITRTIVLMVAWLSMQAIRERAFDLPVTFNHVATADRTSVVAQFPSGARLGLGWTGTDLPGQGERRIFPFRDPSPTEPDIFCPSGIPYPSRRGGKGAVALRIQLQQVRGIGY